MVNNSVISKLKELGAYDIRTKDGITSGISRDGIPFAFSIKETNGSRQKPEEV